MYFLQTIANMVGQLLLEDEYIINVKVRRPLNGSTPPPPPTFTVACHDPQQDSNFMVENHSSSNVDHEIQHPRSFDVSSVKRKIVPGGSDYIGSFTVGPGADHCELPLPLSIRNSNPPKQLEWPGSCQDDYRSSSKHEKKKETSIAMHPGERRIVSGDTFEPVTHLPQVKVYGDDNELLASNTFKTPSGSGLSSKPSQKGSLYVERIADHCQSVSGQLYVPPVQVNKLLEKDQPTPPMRGNSRRSESERLNAKMKKKPFTPIIEKFPDRFIVSDARNRLQDVLRDQVIPENSQHRPLGKSYSTPVCRPNDVSQRLVESCQLEPVLVFPPPTPCVPHNCPREKEINASKHLSHSSTLFPTSPSIPSKESPVKKSLNEKREKVAEHAPCYSSVYDGSFRLKQPIQVTDSTTATEKVHDKPLLSKYPQFEAENHSYRSISSNINLEKASTIKSKPKKWPTVKCPYQVKSSTSDSHIAGGNNPNYLIKNSAHKTISNQDCSKFDFDDEYSTDDLSYYSSPCVSPYKTDFSHKTRSDNATSSSEEESEQSSSPQTLYPTEYRAPMSLRQPNLKKCIRDISFVPKNDLNQSSRVKSYNHIVPNIGNNNRCSRPYHSYNHLNSDNHDWPPFLEKHCDKDISNEIGHPCFHGQTSSFRETNFPGPLKHRTGFSSCRQVRGISSPSKIFNGEC